MISAAEQLLQVWEAIKKLEFKCRPKDVMELFIYIINNIETSTGIVTLTRDELAAKMGTNPNRISIAMGQLEKLNVIRRDRLKIPGTKGRGKARYRLNPYAEWNLDIKKRDE